MIREGDIGEKLFPDFPDMKVDFAEIGIGKIGISDFVDLKFRILANFGKIGNKIFLEFFTQHPLHLSEYSFQSQLKRSFNTFCIGRLGNHNTYPVLTF